VVDVAFCSRALQRELLPWDERPHVKGLKVIEAVVRRQTLTQIRCIEVGWRGEGLGSVRTLLGGYLLVAGHRLRLRFLSNLDSDSGWCCPLRCYGDFTSFDRRESSQINVTELLGLGAKD
jgi:hypothetical protein